MFHFLTYVENGEDGEAEEVVQQDMGYCGEWNGDCGRPNEREE
jgi:hypothetical protein